jgi:hypothetical protein
VEGNDDGLDCEAVREAEAEFFETIDRRSETGFQQQAREWVEPVPRDAAREMVAVHPCMRIKDPVRERGGEETARMIKLETVVGGPVEKVVRRLVAGVADGCGG